MVLCCRLASRLHSRTHRKRSCLIQTSRGTERAALQNSASAGCCEARLACLGLGGTACSTIRSDIERLQVSKVPSVLWHTAVQMANPWARGIAGYRGLLHAQKQCLMLRASMQAGTGGQRSCTAGGNPLLLPASGPGGTTSCAASGGQPSAAWSSCRSRSGALLFCDCTMNMQMCGLSSLMIDFKTHILCFVATATHALSHRVYMGCLATHILLRHLCGTQVVAAGHSHPELPCCALAHIAAVLCSRCSASGPPELRLPRVPERGDQAEMGMEAAHRAGAQLLGCCDLLRARCAVPGTILE